MTKEKRIATCTYARAVSFGDFVIGPGEEKVLPDGLKVPEEWKSHIHVRIEKGKEDVKTDVESVSYGSGKKYKRRNE